MNDAHPQFDEDVVVIGGGAFGTSIALHLAESRGLRIRLLERFDIAEGTTWHSAGMVGQLRSHPEIMQLIRHSAERYAAMEAASPGSLGFHRVGSLRIGTTEVRMAEMAEQAAVARGLGIDAQMIDPAEIARRVPGVDLDGVLGAVWIESDGYTDPEQLAVGLAAAAAEAGATITTGVAVERLDALPGNGWAVQTDLGTITAQTVVIAAGFHTPTLAALAEVFVPLLVSRQQLIGSGPLSPEAGSWPTVREPDRSLVMRPKNDQWIVGSYAPDPEFDDPADIPATPRFVFPAEAERMGPAWQSAAARFPALATVGQADVLKGPEGVTPDGEVILSPSGRPGLWIAAGGSGHGIAAAGGVGWFISEWITTGTPPVDPARFALDRFPDHYRSDHAALRADTIRTEIAHYAVAPSHA